MKIFQFTVEGKAAGEQTYRCTGRVEGEFESLFDAVMRATFQQLTQGKAVYGQPGVGCRGPYTITKFLLEAVEGS